MPAADEVVTGLEDLESLAEVEQEFIEEGGGQERGISESEEGGEAYEEEGTGAPDSQEAPEDAVSGEPAESGEENEEDDAESSFEDEEEQENPEVEGDEESEREEGEEDVGENIADIIEEETEEGMEGVGGEEVSSVTDDESSAEDMENAVEAEEVSEGEEKGADEIAEEEVTEEEMEEKPSSEPAGTLPKKASKKEKKGEKKKPVREKTDKKEKKAKKERKKKGRKEPKKAPKDEMTTEEFFEEEEEPPKEGGLYYKLSPISFFFFAFLSVFLLVEFLMVLFNISIYIPAMFMGIVPIVGGLVREGILFIALLLAAIDMALHYWDRRINIGISLVMTFVMILSLGINIGVSAGATSFDILSQFIFLIMLGIIVIIDLLCFWNYPAVLEDPGRAGFETFLESQNEIEQVIEEEEEKLRLKDREIEEIRNQLELLESEVEEEEEKLRIKDEEIASISSQLEKVQEDLMEEEEKLRVRDEELDTYVQQEVEKRQEEMMLEEEEKLRMKEEEAIRVRNDLEIQKKLHEEAREKLRMKEQELMTLRTELEKQIRERIEEEEKLKLKETAARLEQMEKKKRVLFPFTAIVGQEKMKKALILNAIYPEIGGVLIRGQKGTAKSVSVRALADVLPDIDVTGCRFNCDPAKPEDYCSECRMRAEKNILQTFTRPVQVVDLPLNITEDRLLGSIDIEKILHEGTRSFEPGILAEAHRGILYVDEINLLDDYIVDILLDAASSGRVVIEREGISITHPAKFIIVGSMNPEEGELRPQILDRIALQTDVVGIHDVEKRIDIIRRREEFSKDPEAFREKYRPAQEELKARITEARRILNNVTTPERIYNLIGQICLDFDVDGHRADIIIERAARANAAFEGRLEVTAEDVITAAEMALPHRMRRRPYEGEEFSLDALKRWVNKRELESE